MTGTLLDAKLFEQNGKVILIAQLVEKLNPALAAQLGVPIQSEGTLELLLSSLDSRPRWIVDRIEGGSLNLMAGCRPPTPLSEPPSYAILGAGFLGLFVLLRRARTRSASRYLLA